MNHPALASARAATGRRRVLGPNAGPRAATGAAAGRWLALVAAVLALPIGCSSGNADETPAPRPPAGLSAAGLAGTDPAAGPAAPDPAGPAQLNGAGYLVAESRVARLAVRAQPSSEEPPQLELTHPTPTGAPLVLLVTESVEGWHRVLLPVRPNGAQGWVRADDVTTSGHRWRIDVHLSAHELVVHHGDEVWMVEPVAIGQQPTPTPGGTFYLLELLQPPEPSGPYGPYAFGLSGFSEVLDSFAGGDGRLGLHGTNEPALLGGDVTNGCIRLHNEAITQLAHTLPLGTPLTIHP